MPQFLTDIVHFFITSRKARYMDFRTESGYLFVKRNRGLPSRFSLYV